MFEIDGILYADDQKEMIRVIYAFPMDDYKIKLTFNTGEEKVYDVKALFRFPVFRVLQDAEIFKRMSVSDGTVSWLQGDLDIAPETLYEESVAVMEAGNSVVSKIAEKGSYHVRRKKE